MFQRVYSIVPASQQKTQSVVTSAVIQKTQFNNGQQRIHALPAQLTNARVVPASGATVAAVGTAGTQKVQILSNVVVSKQNIVLNKTPLQVRSFKIHQEFNGTLRVFKKIKHFIKKYIYFAQKTSSILKFRKRLEFNEWL